ncbi:hypothetical protein [Thomasclavelia ramosa]|uniref:hypothetical protein n=1 Tax=Thomasclavelia ramosa TaxID=1547 RepID=UPI0011C10A07|nr:hypothetical protein [Thomasclavelia ramosa]
MICYDMLAVIFSCYASLWIRFDGNIDLKYLSSMNCMVFFIIVLSILVFALNRLYDSLWQFVSIAELRRVIISTITSTFGVALISTFTGYQLPKSWFIIYLMLLTILVGGIRISYRLTRSAIREMKVSTGKHKGGKKVMLILIMNYL